MNKTMLKFGTFVFVLSCVVFVTEALHLPPYLKPCSRSDQNLDDCALKSGQAAIPSVVKGDKKYGIPNLNPLILPSVDLNAGNNFNLKFKNLEVRGLEQMVIKKLHIDPTKHELSITLRTPALDMRGDYTIKGKILVLPIEGQGKANLSFMSPDLSCDANWNEVKNEKGIVYAKLQKTKASYTVQKVSYQFDNLFNGDEKLGKELNTVINDNWKVVDQDLNEPFSEILNQVCNTIISGYFNNVPHSELLPS